MSNLLNEKDVAQLLNVKSGTLRKWRCERRGPKFLRLAGVAVRYRREEIEKFLKKSEAKSVR